MGAGVGGVAWSICCDLIREVMKRDWTARLWR